MRTSREEGKPLMMRRKDWEALGPEIERTAQYLSDAETRVFKYPHGKICSLFGIDENNCESKGDLEVTVETPMAASYSVSLAMVTLLDKMEEEGIDMVVNTRLHSTHVNRKNHLNLFQLFCPMVDTHKMTIKGRGIKITNEKVRKFFYREIGQPSLDFSLEYPELNPDFLLL